MDRRYHPRSGVWNAIRCGDGIGGEYSRNVRGISHIFHDLGIHHCWRARAI